MKKEYMKPNVKVIQLQHQCHILAGSGGVRGVRGLSDDFNVSEEEGDGSDAW